MGNTGSSGGNTRWRHAGSRRGNPAPPPPQPPLSEITSNRVVLTAATPYLVQYPNSNPNANANTPQYYQYSGYYLPPSPPMPAPLPAPYDHDHHHVPQGNWVGGRYPCAPVMQPRAPYVEHQKMVTIRNDVNLKKESLKVEVDEENPGKFLVSFTFDATVAGSISVLFFAKEGEDCVLTPTKDNLPPVTIHFEQGLGQKFKQPPGTGIDFSIFTETELSRDIATDIYPLAVKAEVSSVSQSGSDGNPVSGTINSQITQAVFEKEKGEYQVRVVKQILWFNGIRYELQEIYGIGNSVENEFDDNDLGKECVICLSEPRDTIVLPCRHMCICSGCAKVLRFQTDRCPICRQPVEMLLEIEVGREFQAKDYQDPPPAPLVDAEELTKWSFYRAIIAEFIATLLFLYIAVLTVIGYGSQTDEKQNKTDCDGVGILGIAWAFGGMIFVLVYCTAGISGGHINPAVTFGLFLARKVSLSRAIMYMVAQCLGAICGCGLVKAFQKAYYSEYGGGANKVAPEYSKGTALGAEIIGTFVLVYTVFSATDPKRNARDSHVPVLAPLPIGFAVFMVHLATIPITGTGINPARSFGAAVIYGHDDAWDDQWIFWVGPFVGAAIAAIYHQYILRAAAVKAFGSFRSSSTI